MPNTAESVLAELNRRLDASARIDAEADRISERFRGEVNGLNRHLKHVPQIVCADGFKMSVQASAFHYCSPRDSEGPWSRVEVGFPSDRVEALMPWAEDENDPTGTVYGYVPLRIVAEVIDQHGGFAS